MTAHGGAADSYYSEGQSQPQVQYPPQTFNLNNRSQGPPGGKTGQAPPGYDQNFPNSGERPSVDGKQTFEQAFKLEKPKYNDLWAGILVKGLSMSHWLSANERCALARPNFPWVRRSLWTVVARLLFK